MSRRPKAALSCQTCGCCPRSRAPEEYKGMSVAEAQVRSLAWKYLGYPAFDILKSEAWGKYGALSTKLCKLCFRLLLQGAPSAHIPEQSAVETWNCWVNFVCNLCKSEKHSCFKKLLRAPDACSGLFIKLCLSSDFQRAKRCKEHICSQVEMLLHNF